MRIPDYQFTPEARDDLQGIIDYTLVHWGKKQALKYVDGLEGLVAQLAENPGLGANHDTLIDGLISFPYVSHVLYYVSLDHGITIIRGLHKNMDARRYFDGAKSPIGRRGGGIGGGFGRGGGGGGFRTGGGF